MAQYTIEIIYNADGSWSFPTNNPHNGHTSKRRDTITWFCRKYDWVVFFDDKKGTPLTTPGTVSGNANQRGSGTIRDTVAAKERYCWKAKVFVGGGASRTSPDPEIVIDDDPVPDKKKRRAAPRVKPKRGTSKNATAKKRVAKKGRRSGPAEKKP